MCPTTSALTLDRSVQAGPVHVPVQVRHGAGWPDEVTSALRQMGAERIVVLTDPSLPTALLARVLASLDSAAPTEVRWLTAGRRLPAEGPRTVPDGSAVVALGGTRIVEAADRLVHADGTPPPLLRLPTTLRAMADAALSVAGRGGVAGAGPGRILVRDQLDFLETLDAWALRAGVCALVRDVLAVVPGSYDQVAARLRRDGHYDPCTLASFLSLCVEVRSALLRYDPLETGPAMVLHYGRALTRALRASTRPGAPPHGDAPLLGLRVAARVARLSGLLDTAGEQAHTELVERAGGPSALLLGADAEDVLAELVHGHAGRRLPHRRAARAGTDRVGMVLLDGLGTPHLERGRAVTPVGVDVLRAALEAFAATPAPAGRTRGLGLGQGSGQGPGQDHSLMPLGRRAPESR
ncbi:hypothetical protein H4W23_02060 [Streptomyces gardneri]|uniref:3-dehydroquinate synthase family protein n=1 Tax=Streptomyces gardneri TaxID=66892 RepID=UPI0006BDC3C2|nr:hypothetical protein [Streptomyces gardneri]QPK43528.1 hypothetical protein H4W23_02060 [Streptomyces gardneri]WRK34764.1 hypothetical protein U0M97_02075 [Streptomyces venezuelae]CUM43740.1 3-dehydroquinate synthase \